MYLYTRLFRRGVLLQRDVEDDDLLTRLSLNLFKEFDGLKPLPLLEFCSVSKIEVNYLLVERYDTHSYIHLNIYTLQYIHT